MPKQDFRNEPTVLSAILKVAPNSTASFRVNLQSKERQQIKEWLLLSDTIFEVISIYSALQGLGNK